MGPQLERLGIRPSDVHWVVMTLPAHRGQPSGKNRPKLGNAL